MTGTGPTDGDGTADTAGETPTEADAAVSGVSDSVTERRTRAAVEGLETSARSGESPAETCRYCGRPFASTDAHALHVGEIHPEACTDAERTAADAADERERDELFYFHLRVVAAIAALYTVIVLLYMIALGSGLL